MEISQCFKPHDAILCCLHILLNVKLLHESILSAAVDDADLRPPDTGGLDVTG